MANNSKQSDVICKVRKKKRGFSIIDNAAIDDLNISIEALGVYNVFKRWSTFEAENFTCSKSFIRSKSRCGEKKFERIWKELKEAGYIKMYFDGNIWSAELLEEPEANTPHTYFLNAAGEVKRTVSVGDKTEEILSPPQKRGGAKKSESHPPHLRGDSTSGDSMSGGLKQGNNINTSFKNSFNNSFIDNQSINLNEPEAPKGKAPKKIDRLIDADTLNDIKDQIQYDYLAKEHDKGLLDTAVSCIADLYCATEPQTFNGRTYAVDLIHQRSLEIELDHLQYVFECFKEQRDKVYNIRKYLTTAIFNAPDTMGAYYENAVRADGVVW